MHEGEGTTAARDAADPMDRAGSATGSRKRFLELVGGAGAAGLFGSLLAGCGTSEGQGEGERRKSGPGAEALPGAGDLDIVNYALLLELLEADFYRQANESGEIRDREFSELSKRIGENEAEHVDALSATAKQMGASSVEKPGTDFEQVLAGGEGRILETASLIENVGASAYLGQADKIHSPDILAVALSIHTVEARHAAALNDLAGSGFRSSGGLVGSVPNGAFAKPMSMDEVLRRMKPFRAQGRNRR